MNIPETSTQSHKRKVLFLYGLLFVFLSIILSKAPLISDDFEFADLALTNPKDLLNYALHYGNGRLMGNLTSVYLVNFPILCACFKSVVFCGIIFFLSKIFGGKSFLVTALFSALILGANPDLMGQVFTWTSGWANYVPPILFALICIYVITGANRFSPIRAVIIGVLGIIGQLYVEHFTVIQILIAFVFLLIYCKQHTRPKKYYCIIWLTASILGALIMYLIPKVFTMGNSSRMSWYRGFHVKDLVQYASSSLAVIVSTLSKCTVLLALFSLFGFSVNNSTSVLAKLKRILYCIYPIIPYFYTWANRQVGFSLGLVLAVIQYGGLLVYALCIVIDIAKVHDKQKRLSMLFAIALAVISVAPFLFISPFGERCIYLAYILLSIASVIGIQYCLESKLILRIKHLHIVCATTTVCFCIIIAISMLRTHHYDTLRDAYICAEVAEGNREITVFNFPSKYTFQTICINKYYYIDEPGDIEFHVVELDEWLETHSFPND